MRLLKELGAVLCVILLMRNCRGDDISDFDEYVEFEDSEITSDYLIEEMNSAINVGVSSENNDESKELAEELRRFWNFESDLNEVLASEDFKRDSSQDESMSQEEINVEFSDPEMDFNTHDRDVHEQSIRYFIDQLLRKYDMISIEPHSGSSDKVSCLDLSQSSAANARTTCGSVNTSLGLVDWCHVTCNPGYKLGRLTPQYELCGKVTKHRWTYQLEGLTSPSERCIVGNSSTSANICTTPQCMATAAYYMNKIDFTVDPCSNFYDFACGRWIKETKVPKSKSFYLTYTVIRDRVNSEVGDLLETPITNKDSDAVAKTKTIYMSCIDTKVINELGAQPLLDLLRGDMAWPIIDSNWDESSFNFESTSAALLGKYHNKMTVEIIVSPSNNKYILQSWKGKMPLPFKYYSNPLYKPRLDAYYSLLYDIALMLGANPITAYLDIEDVKVFERQLAMHKWHDWDYQTEKTLDQMNDQIPGIDWLRLYTEMIESHPVNGLTKVEVWNEMFLKNLVKLIQQTDKRTVQNYMVWTTVKFRLKNLSNKFLKRYLEYEHVMSGKLALSPRKYKCSNELIFGMKGPTGKLFIDAYFSEAKKKAAEELFDFIRKGFIHLLETEVQWMDVKTKDYAKRKAEAIKANIGYNPDLYKNVTYLDDQTAHLIVNISTYFKNYLSLLEMISQNVFKKLGHKFVGSEFTVRPTMVNAFYSPTFNTINLPAGEMQYPFYWGDEFPMAYQFGAIGTILGHELTHGFDNNGRQYGIDGTMKNWWTPSSLKQFNKRTKCMEDQYSDYWWNKAGEYLNGRQDITENIADNGGIRESYAGYHLWLKHQNMTGEKLEPSTGLTNDQMFFVGFANDRCGVYTHAGAVHDLAINTHSPGRFRVIGSLQNFDKFSKAFNCPLGSYMNPRKKCVIW